MSPAVRTVEDDALPAGMDQGDSAMGFGGVATSSVVLASWVSCRALVALAALGDTAMVEVGPAHAGVFPAHVGVARCRLARVRRRLVLPV